MKLFQSGYCKANQKIVNPSKPLKEIEFYAIWGLFEIPEIGYVMFDTGYSEHFNVATRRFPDKLYKFATPIELKSGESAKEILQSIGISPADIKYIVISHFHADHIAGILDFPDSQFICSKSAYNEVLVKDGFAAVRKGILKKLLPDTMSQRTVFIEDLADQISTDDFGITWYSLFNQTKFQLLSLPGHARGQLGFRFNSENIDILFGTDAAWDVDAFEQGIYPLKIVKIFIDSYTELIETQHKLLKFKKSNPKTKILFTHCPQTLQFIENNV